MPLYAATLEIDLHLPQSRSLKEKRAVLRPIIEGLRRRFALAVAEINHQDQWQRACVGMAAVSSSAGQLTEILDAAERFVWSHPEIEVVGAQRRWVDGT